MSPSASKMSSPGVPEQPASRPALPEDAREFLHLLAIDAWRALAIRQPAPEVDLGELSVVIGDAFETPRGNLSDQIYDTWYRLAREHGVPDVDGDFPEPLQAAVNEMITAAIWFGITTGYHTLAGRFSVPRRLMPYFEDTVTGSRNGGAL